MRLCIFLLLAFVISIGSACEGESGRNVSAARDATKTASGIAGSFVGKAEGSEAYVGIVVLETREVLAYACDGKAVARWFRGQVSDDSLSLTSSGARLEAKLTTQGASGTLQIGSTKPLKFDAKPSEGNAGLYRATTEYGGRTFVGGWVVLDDGTQRGSVAANPGTSTPAASGTSAGQPGQGSPPTHSDSPTVSPPAGAGRASTIIADAGAAFTSMEAAIEIQFAKLPQQGTSKGQTPTPAASPVVIAANVTLQPRKLTSAGAVATLK